MPKLLKSNKQAEQNRNRVRIHRGVQSILRNDRIDVNNQNSSDINWVNNEHTNVYEVVTFTHKIKKHSEKSLADKLRTWALECRVKHDHVSKLLKILKSCGMNFLPMDCRTLLSTPQSVQIEQKAGGKMWYGGVENGLRKIFPILTADKSIQLNINADGLPLYNGSSVEFWPLLANIRGKSIMICMIFFTWSKYSNI